MDILPVEIGAPNISTIEEFVALFFAGMCGAFVRDLWLGGGKLDLFRIETREDGTKCIQLGFVSSLILGGFVGIVVDQSWLTALFSAIAAPIVLEVFMNKMRDHFTKNFMSDDKDKGGDK